MDADPHTTRLFPVDMSSPISTLPPELLHEIAAQLGHLPSLVSLALVSHAWNAAATNVMYNGRKFICFWILNGQAPDDTWSKPCQLARTIAARPDLAARITGLSFSMALMGFNMFHPIHETTGPIDIHVASAVEVFRTILHAVPNVATLDLAGARTPEEADAILDAVASVTQAMSRIHSLAVIPRSQRLIKLLAAMPSLRRLDIYQLPRPATTPLPPTTIALRYLCVFKPVTNEEVNILRSSPTQESLEEIGFTPASDDPPRWHGFSSLETIRIVFPAGFGEAAKQSLTTCTVAKAIELKFIGKDVFAMLQEHNILHCLSSSLTKLKISDSSRALVSDYFINWLRTGSTGWPSLRSVELCNPSSVKSVTKEERERVMKEFDEVCEGRGLECRWVS